MSAEREGLEPDARYVEWWGYTVESPIRGLTPMLLTFRSREAAEAGRDSDHVHFPQDKLGPVVALYSEPVGVRAPGAGLREELVTAWNEAARWRDFDKACFEGELAQQIAPIVDRIVREDAGRAPESERETYRNPEPCQRHEIAGCVACDDRICRGSEALGTACGRCSKCRARLRAPAGSEPEEDE
jgi:hypothetical protein